MRGKHPTFDHFAQASERKMRVGQAPRWKAALDRALEADPKSNVYQLATIHDALDASTSSNLQPRVRTVVHRGFLVAEARPPVLPLLLTTTDIRSPKASQFAHNSRVEIAWWVPGVQEQFRISGNAYVLPSSQFLEDAVHLQSGTGPLPEAETRRIVQAARELRDAFLKAVLVQGGFDWESKRVEVFESMSAHMRASWIQPVPGTPMARYEDAKHWLETVPKNGEANEDEKSIVNEALRNFALVVINPFSVDHVELGVVPNQRTMYMRSGDAWAEQVLVP